MSTRREIDTAAGRVHVVFTDRADGDFHLDGDPARRDAAARAVVDLPWSWVRQVHGTDVVVVRHPGDGAGLEGDGLVTTTAGAVLSVRGADCPVVALVSRDGVIGVAHAGWRGLVAGVLERTVEVMRANGATTIAGHLGPCITAGRYEFGPDDLDVAARRLGPQVRARTDWGTPALDLVAGVTAALHRCGVTVDLSAHRCTAGDPSYFSHRARREQGRHAVAVWLEPS
jgi:YfiH family protein